ncbi:MAG TPA: VWA-like domain-containing protein [Thermoanaerobaculia bacterium]|nr:VWA-like domain-containing protein [Thermoanaerobaculia bacterium]
MPRKPDKEREDPATKAFREATEAIREHPLFSPLFYRTNLYRNVHQNSCPPGGWAVASHRGTIYVHPKRRAAPEEWLWVIGHCLLHYGFGHFRVRARPDLWNIACDLFVDRFLADLKLGRRPEEIPALAPPQGAPLSSENALYDWLFESGVPPELRGGGTAGPGAGDLSIEEDRWAGKLEDYDKDWRAALAAGLRNAVAAAVQVAGGQVANLAGAVGPKTPSERGRSWFMTRYPLLGALAASFKLVEDAEVCRRLDIHVAAVDAEARELYVNPQMGMNDGEACFVMAHELLHVGLRHQARCQGRDPYLWNVACDYVINAWLVEMEVGRPPAFGVLLDPELKGLSAEAVYDRIVGDLRRMRKLATFRGTGLGDMLPGRNPRWWQAGEGMALDEFYRSCLAQGLVWHRDRGRGFLPAGLVEEIEAMAQPAIPWDVLLAQWFDHRFPPKEKRRTFARPSRRQMATPDIPRPHLAPLDDGSSRTFAVLLDTSGSMDRKLLAKSLGAIASYGTAREVDLVRLIFCDAATYDEGYVRPEEIAGRVRIKGRGGTVLQPGIDLLQKSLDFPPDGPILIITDGYCDSLTIRRDHAFLVPAGNSLPFRPQGPVFWVS